MSARRIPDAVRAVQARASDPAASAFVAANAGSGKTHVLAQRVIRLLLAGVDPGRILCITFTKAAAANMATRVFETLASWIALDDDALDQAIHALGVTGATPALRTSARRLFAAALETPGGLKVQTIHAFCTRLLHQFPFEANVAARFAVLDERGERDLTDQATTAVLLEAARDPAAPLGGALAAAVSAAADTTFRDVVREAIGERDAVTAWIAAAGGVEAAIADLARDLGLDPADAIERVEAEIVDGPNLPSADWAGLAALCGTSTATDQRQCERLGAAAAARGPARIDAYLSVFFTDAQAPRKSIVTAALANRHDGLAARLAREQARLVGLVERRKAIACRDRTAALVAISRAAITRYRAEKDRRGLLDYDDLIDRTLAMLATVNPGWVHYKLDLGIDHVLIDEAQDTSDKQWQIVRRLVAEFAAGVGARRVKRTVFAVGDEKQSIFSFQGAAPRMFDEMRRAFRAEFDIPELGFHDVRFHHSFRSGANVLGAVDEVFRAAEVHVSITSDAGGVPPHEALPDAPPGMVEIWPLVRPEDRREIEGWDAPFDDLAETSPQVRLARKLARTVRDAIDRNEIAGSTGRPLRAGDVLVLVRQRGALFEAIIRALKDAGVPVAGADRLVLTEHVAVADMMALADALLLPDDDLALAVALKSPLFGIDEDQLFRLAWRRKGTLRDALRTAAAGDAAVAPAFERLERCRRNAHRPPFDFFAWLLGPEGGRARFFARLGHEAADALDEFLALALDYEEREPPSLQGFLAWLRAAETEIKRDMEISRDEVRVMTVHGAKGLEAPLVILADTTTRPIGARPPRLLRLRPARAAPGAPEHLVWAGRKDADVAVVAAARARAFREAEDEHRRLLYVAMTRAADRLIVAGCAGANKIPDGCWYDLVTKGLEGKDGFSRLGEEADAVGVYRRLAQQPAAFGSPAAPAPEFVYPAWLRSPAPSEPKRGAITTPSSAAEDAGPEMPEGGGAERGRALKRGLLIHRLIQALPDIAPTRRGAAAQDYLARAAQDFAPEDHAHFVDETVAILDDRRFTPLFAPGSRAEVPIVGRLARAGRPPLVVSGQVDRLVVTDEAVLIADFKTNRPAPASLAEAERRYPAYVVQLALYRAVLARLYPDRPVRAALLWTDVPDLMELSAKSLDAALVRIIVA